MAGLPVEVTVCDVKMAYVLPVHGVPATRSVQRGWDEPLPTVQLHLQLSNPLIVKELPLVATKSSVSRAALVRNGGLSATSICNMRRAPLGVTASEVKMKTGLYISGAGGGSSSHLT